MSVSLTTSFGSVRMNTQDVTVSGDNRIQIGLYDATLLIRDSGAFMPSTGSFSLNPIFQGVTAGVNGIIDSGKLVLAPVNYAAGGSIGLRFDLGARANINLVSNATFSSSTLLPNAIQILELENNTTGSFSLSWPTGWTWGPGLPPTSIGATGYYRIFLTSASTQDNGVTAFYVAPQPVIVSNVTAMRALSSNGWLDGQQVILLGYNNEGDGGGGDLFWYASDTTSDNGGTIFKLTNTITGRLHRFIPGSKGGTQLMNTILDIRWFGAIPDIATDCTAPLLSAFNTAQFGGSIGCAALYAPAGTYLFLTKLVINSGQNLTIKGDGKFATQFLFGFQSSDTAWWDISGLAQGVSINDIGFNYINYGSGTVNISQYLYFHSLPYLELVNIYGSGLTGTWINIVSISAWLSCINITSANASGSQVIINGAGGTFTNFNLGAGFGAPALMLLSCNALNVSNGQVSGGGPYKSKGSASITSNSTTFTITWNSHGFLAGDYIYITSATHSGYNNIWKIASVTTNTIVVTSNANLGSDTATVSSLWSNIYLGGAGSSNLVTESSMDGILCNNAIGGTNPGYVGMFLDGFSNGSVVGTRISDFDCDAGFTKLFIHGQNSSSYDGVNSWLYSIATSSTYSFTIYTASAHTSAGSFVNGHIYVIEFVGTTDFTLIGASSNTIGVQFTATGAGSGTGTAINSATHSLRAGAYVHITTGTYAGYWKISTITSNTFTVNSTSNLGTAITVPVEGDSIASSVGSINISKITAGSGQNNTFGGIRVEGGNNICFDNCFVALGAGASVNNSYGVVVSDGGQTIPTVDIFFIGGQYCTINQALISPGETLIPFTLDGPNLWGVSILNVIMTGFSPQNVFQFTNGFSNIYLNTNFFSRMCTVTRIGTSGQDFTSGVQASVSWSSVVFDDSYSWNIANPTRLTPPNGVTRIRITANVHWTSNPTPVYVTIQRTGATPSQCGSVAQASQPFNAQVSLDSGTLLVTPGDYYEVQCYQTSGSTQNLADSPETKMSMEIIA